MKTHKALIPLAICVAAGLISGCNKDGAAAPTKPANVDAVPVEVAAAARKPISASYSGTAALVTDNEAQVTSKASGVLKKLLVEEGMTSVLVTHEMAFARQVADHVYFTDHGVIVEDGPPAQLFGAPQKERTRAFLEQVA